MYDCKDYYDLSKKYMKFKDPKSAYDLCIKSISLNPHYMEPLYYAVHIMNMQSIPLSDIKANLETLLKPVSSNYCTIAHIFYMERCYNTSIEYVDKYSKNGPDNIEFLKVKCLVRSSRYNECIDYINTISKNNLYYFNIAMYKILCLICCGKFEDAFNILNFRYRNLSDYNIKMLSVYNQFYNIVTGIKPSILCENDKIYTSCIFEICDVFLINKEFDLFEKALGLLNLTSDKSVLIKLANLYYRYGYVELAKNEVMRSLKLFDVIDKDSFDILYSYLELKGGK